MDSNGRCREHPENEPHCLHGAGESACCWCGDVFMPLGEARAEHGSNFHPLNAREVEIATLLTEGLSNKLIADRLQITESLTHYYLVRMFKKLNKNTRTGVVAAVIRRGIVP